MNEMTYIRTKINDVPVLLEIETHHENKMFRTMADNDWPLIGLSRQKDEPADDFFEVKKNIENSMI